MRNSTPHIRRIRRARGKGGVPKLNLVSLMDVFTILVFFLLVNSSSVQQSTGEGIKLPEAKVEKPVGEALVIQVNGESIIVQGRKVAAVPQVLLDDQAYIPALQTELEYQAKRAGERPPEGFSATVMGDRELPFALLKKIMVTAGRAEYGHISLAVIQKGQRDQQ